jgi:hypothetical protein
MAPAPEILDFEISYGGDCLGNCPMCYKDNSGPQPTVNLSFEDFKTILDKMPPLLTQVAFGIMNISTNPDFFKMMEYCRERGIVPNYTCHGLDVTPEIAERTAALCGAVAVSVYDKEKSYNAIKMFTDAGMKQVNIHCMLSEETFGFAKKIVYDIHTDIRLEKLNAIVFLAYKPKGREGGKKFFHTIKDPEKYKELIQYCTDLKVNWGCDSCSAPIVLQAFQGTGRYGSVAPFIEPCESSLFSSYISAEGMFFPCSFTEGESGWEQGLDVLHCDNFVQDIWMHPRTIAFRENLIGSCEGCSGCHSQKICRSCPVFDITGCVIPRED